MPKPQVTSRREFVRAAGAVGASVLLGGCAMLKRAEGGAQEAGTPPAPAECLMREHGVFERVLLVYGEALRRFDAREEMPAEPLAEAASIMRSFAEDYHEKLEEEELFPRFRKAGLMVDLVDTLQEQHQAARRLTDATLRLATANAIDNVASRQYLASALRWFARMYAPHLARESTVLFPAIRAVTAPAEYAALGEAFEKRERDLFASHGFATMVDRIAEVEKELGIYELRKFTPKG